MDTIIVHAGRLIDGKGEKAKENVHIRIQSRQIHSIRHAPFPDQTQVRQLDFGTDTLVPLFMDSHVHLFMSGTTEPGIREAQLSQSYVKAEKVIRQHLKDHLLHGILAVRDGGDSHAHVLRYVEDHRKNSNDPFSFAKEPVRIRCTCHAYKKPGRYGKLIASSFPSHREILGDMETYLRRINHIKIVQSGLNSLTSFGKETPPQFFQKELGAVTSFARDHHLPVMVHANGKLPVSIALEAGVDSIEHGFFMGEENLRKMADRQIAWVPTACTMEAYSSLPEADAGTKEISRKNLEHQLGQMEKARSLGVPVCLGTDAGSPGVDHGKAVYMELRLFQQAGFSMEEAVRCATRNNARLMGIRGFGEITPGSSASFIVFAGKTGENTILPENIRAVMVDGELKSI